MNNRNTVLRVLHSLLLFCGIALGALLAIPMFIGAFNIIYQNGSIPSATASIGLAIVATALGAAVLWFAARSKSDDNAKSNGESDANRKTAEHIRRGVMADGMALLFAAMCFTLFGLLAPVLPDAIQAEDFFLVLVKWTAVLSLMAGSIALGLTLCVGIFTLWFWNIGR